MRHFQRHFKLPNWVHLTLSSGDTSRRDNTPIFTVYSGPKRRLKALAVFLLCGAADSDRSSGPALPASRFPDVLFQPRSLFWFILTYLAHCSRRRPPSFVAFLTSRKRQNSRGGCLRWCGSPFPPQVSVRRLPSTDAAPESPEAGWCDRLSRPADSWISRFFLRSLRPQRSPLNSSSVPSYVDMFNLAVCTSLSWKYLTNVFAALPASHQETAALYLSISTHEPIVRAAHLCSAREGWQEGGGGRGWIWTASYIDLK